MQNPSFTEFDQMVEKARVTFRSHARKEQGQFSRAFDLFRDLLDSISKSRNSEEWENSKEKDYFLVTIRALEIVFAIYYLDESGFYEASLVFKRNYIELALIGMAIGYDRLCHTDWKNERKYMKDAHKISKRIKNSSYIPPEYKDFSDFLLSGWNEASALYSHQLTPSSIRKSEDVGSFRLGIDIVEEDAQANRVRAEAQMILNLISVTLDVFDYQNLIATHPKQHPEGIDLVKRFSVLSDELSLSIF